MHLRLATQLTTQRIARKRLTLDLPPFMRYALLVDQRPLHNPPRAIPVPDAVPILSAIRHLNHFVEIQIVVAFAFPIQHHAAMEVVEPDFGRPAGDEFIVEPHPVVAVFGGKIAHFFSTVGPAVVIGLVVRMRAVVGKPAHQPRAVFIDFVAVGIVVAIPTVPHAFVFG